MATNLYPPGPGAATANDFGLISSGLVQYPSWAIHSNGYGWRESESDYGQTSSS